MEFRMRGAREVEVVGDEAEPPGKTDGLIAFASTTAITGAAQLSPGHFHKPRPKGRAKPKVVPAAARFAINQQTQAFRQRFFPGVSVCEWNDWHWQLRNRIRDLSTLAGLIRLTTDERLAIQRHGGALPLAVTPYYASLLAIDDAAQPLRRTVVPVMAEYCRGVGEADDPLGEEADSPVPGLVHRYPDRVLFLATDFCSTHCRYCTRSRLVGRDNSCQPSFARWEKALDYIRGTPAIRDVLISGGDPLTMSNDRLEWLLSRLKQISHVEFLRIGTKAPVVMPQRITLALTRMLKRYHPLWMSIHFTHPAELTAEVAQACNRLADAGIPLGSQTVLLAGINDNQATMQQLMHGLLRLRVKPYYLYQCDPISGSAHFRTSVAQGLAIIKGLRGHTSGYAVPTYVIDAPGGGGKIPLLPDYVMGRDGTDLLLRNYQDNLYRYPDSAGSPARDRAKPFSG